VCVVLQLVGSPPAAYIIIGNALLPDLLCTCCNNSWWVGMHMHCSRTMCFAKSVLGKGPQALQHNKDFSCPCCVAAPGDPSPTRALHKGVGSVRFKPC